MPGPASHRCLFLRLEGPGAGGIGGLVENPIHAGGSLAGNDSQEASSILSQHVTNLFAVGFIDSGRPRGGGLSLEFLGHDFLVHSRRKGWLSLIAMPTPERSDPHYTAGGVSGWGRIRRPCRRDFTHQRCKEAIRSPFLNSSMPEK